MYTHKSIPILACGPYVYVITSKNKVGVKKNKKNKKKIKKKRTGVPMAEWYNPRAIIILLLFLSFIFYLGNKELKPLYTI